MNPEYPRTTLQVYIPKGPSEKKTVEDTDTQALFDSQLPDFKQLPINCIHIIAIAHEMDNSEQKLKLSSPILY